MTLSRLCPIGFTFTSASFDGDPISWTYMGRSGGVPLFENGDDEYAPRAWSARLEAEAQRAYIESRIADGHSASRLMRSVSVGTGTPDERAAPGDSNRADRAPINSNDNKEIVR